MKDFTLHPEALELKQLGFDEPCLGWFASDRTLVKEVTEKTDFTLAPTYSQAFRWFREKYGLYNYVTTYDSTDFEWYIYDKDQNDWEDDTTQNTYEEAELACLQHLIKIVKEQQK